ncbi:MAG: penicillin acylase family protein [Phenylobacterium zucineum]|nr:MAG: penicillin acylase family protein [Phenylobacterium zucineum]
MRRTFILLAVLTATGAQAAPAQISQIVSGLTAPAEIRIDTWGIPHIYAASVRDAFFLQGYNAARDRLWQIDLWRKRGLGRLAQDFGPAYVAQDRAARLFLYRGDMDAEWAAYGPGAKANTEAWVAGVNAYVTEVTAGKRDLPSEFKLAGSRPETWSADDVVRIRSHGLTRNVSLEVARAEIACAAGLPAARLLKLLEPAWTTKIPEGLDPCDVPVGVLTDYDLATSGVRFSPKTAGHAALDVPADAVGSNNWTIASSHTTTGRPILANDPHREHGAPSLRYIVHLEAPGFSAIGAGEPALPGVSIGHNATAAFGLTIFPADQEDLYVYETDPKDPDLYRYGPGWERMTTVTETVAIKGQADRQVTLKFTRHGPVVFADADKHRAFAVRTVWSQPGTSAYFGSMGYMTATNWPDFKQSLAKWGAPSENQMYADTSGHIGWVAAGRVPKRPNWDGLLPVPGDGRYEWQGALSLDELPGDADPKSGWIASANAMNLPEDYPIAERKVGFEWSNNARITRISEVLGGKPKISLADAMALQTDPTDVTSRRLITLLVPLKSQDPKAALGLALLKDWKGTTTADSAAAAVFETWTGKYLIKAMVNAAAPEAARPLLGGADLAAVMTYLEAPDAGLTAQARDQVLISSLAAAVDEVRQKLGPDPKTWAWGRLHQAEFIHALSPLASPEQQASLKVGPTPMAGTSLSPMAASWRADTFRVTAGASFRMVLDVGRWDASRTINTPGQSGNPDSPHFRDLFPLWVTGRYVPLTYSRKAVEAVTETVIKLSPG